MKKIRKAGRTQPREAVDFYKENPDLFDKLQNGETIEVPDDVFYELKGVVETDEDRVDNVKTYSKSKKKTSSSKTLTDKFIEANRTVKPETTSHSGPVEPVSEDDIVIRHNEEIKLEDKVED